MTGIIVSILARGFGSGVQFLAFSLLAMVLIPSDFGIVQLNLSIFSFVAVLSKLGMENKLMAALGYGGRCVDGEISDKEKIVFYVVFFVSFSLCLLLFLGVNRIYFIHEIYSLALGANFSFIATGIALLSIIASIYRAIGYPVKSSLLEFALPYGVLIVALTMIEPSPGCVLLSFSIGLVLSVLFGVIGLGKFGDIKICSLLKKSQDLISESKSLYLVEILNFLMVWIPVWVLAYMLDDRQVGIYTLAFRVSQVFNVVLIGANARAVSKIAKYIAAKKLSGAARVSRRVSCAVISILGPCFVAVVVLGRDVLTVISPEYMDSFSVLLVLAIGQLINAYTASSQMILIFSGMDRFIRNIIIVAFFLTCIVSILLIPLYGGLGAAIGAVSGLVFQNICSVVFCKLKFDSIPIYVPFGRSGDWG